MLLAMMPMCFAACCSDDDAESGGLDASIEGTWRIKSVKWSNYTKGGSIEPTDKIKEYDETTTQGLTITKQQITKKPSLIEAAFLQGFGKKCLYLWVYLR